MQWEPHIQAGVGFKARSGSIFFSQKSGAAAAVPSAPPPTALIDLIVSVTEAMNAV